MSPVVSVVIATLGRPRRLSRAIESVLAQTFSEFELVVVDDGSPPGLLEETRRRVEGAGHRWIVHSRNRGPAAARNTGAVAGRGAWLAFLDSDDLWLPTKLESQVNWHESNPGFRISQCEEAWFRRGARVEKPEHLRQPEGDLFRESLDRCCISPSAVMIRRDLWEECGGFDEWFRVCEDYELWIRITRKERVGLVGEELVRKLGGEPDQLTSAVEHGIDRWRVMALLGFLEKASPDADEFERVVRVLHRKAGIMGGRVSREIRKAQQNGVPAGHVSIPK